MQKLYATRYISRYFGLSVVAGQAGNLVLETSIHASELQKYEKAFKCRQPVQEQKTYLAVGGGRVANDFSW